jgi:hypothetical protein
MGIKFKPKSALAGKIEYEFILTTQFRNQCLYCCTPKITQEKDRNM